MSYSLSKYQKAFLEGNGKIAFKPRGSAAIAESIAPLRYRSEAIVKIKSMPTGTMRGQTVYRVYLDEPGPQTKQENQK